MSFKSFKDYVLLKEGDNPSGSGESGADKDWKKKFTQIDPGFVPPPKLRPIIDAFVKSAEVKIMGDTTKEMTMPKKSLFLTGGSVRDFLRGKSVRKYSLVTNATPEQTAQILHSAGFKMAGDCPTENLKLTFKPEVAKEGDKLIWNCGAKDNSKEKKAYSIKATVEGEEFDINTMRRDPKVSFGSANADFTDNPKDDAQGRDLTMNANYIELSKSDGPNTKLYDPTETGHYDTMQGVIKTIGDPEQKFKEDKIRVMRAVRLHCRYGKGPMDEKIEKAIGRFRDLDGVPGDQVKEEFLKGLLHPDIDPKCYINMYKKTDLLKKVFPGLKFDPPSGVPVEISDKKDKALALAWLLQHNPVEAVEKALAGDYEDDNGQIKKSGWGDDEKNAVCFLLKLKEFAPEHLPKMMAQREGTGLSKQQIEDWVDMFKIKGTERNRRPWWAKHVKKFAGWRKTTKFDDAVKSGKAKGDEDEFKKNKIVDDMEVEKFMKDD